MTLLIFSLLSCWEKDPMDMLNGRTWQLVQFTANIGQISPKGSAPITAIFENSVLSGSTACNDYQVPITTKPGHLRISQPISVSERYCEGLMSQESLYLDQLRTANKFAVRGDTLEIQCSKGLLIFLHMEGGSSRELPQFFQGILTLGNEVSDFQDCNDSQLTYWVVDETNTLAAAYQQLAHVPYEPIYLEMEAVKENPLLLGYAEERDGLMSIRKILKMHKVNENHPCFSK